MLLITAKSKWWGRALGRQLSSISASSSMEGISVKGRRGRNENHIGKTWGRAKTCLESN